MKKLDTHYSTISHIYADYREIEKRNFINEEAARKDTIKDTSNVCFELYKNDRYITENGRILTKNTFMGNIVSRKEEKTRYLQLCGVDKKNDEHPICAFNFFRNAKLHLPEIDKEYNYEYYNIYKITEELINEDVVQTFEFFATLPSRKTRVTNYFGISAINEFDNEILIENFITLRELERYNIIPEEKYSQYNNYEVLLIYSEDGIIEKRIPLKQINNKKEAKKVRKLHRR